MLKASFEAVLGDIRARFTEAPSVPSTSWQSTKAPQSMPEILNYSFTLDLTGVGFKAKTLAEAIGPNLPWADEHFIHERVSGQPLNPGTTWRQWPYAASADKHRREGEKDPQFDHSYAERYWPMHAGRTPDGRLTSPPDGSCNMGIRFRYGLQTRPMPAILQDFKSCGWLNRN